ncbi:MAG: dihydropteroate synthase [Myxococcota bacterium]
MVLQLRTTPPPVRLPSGRPLTFGRTRMMGVVNVTPDSFSDGGRFLDAEAAVAHGVSLARDGADILDVGGESTRPGSAPVPAEEQIRRVVPVLQALSREVDVPVSIDTTSAEVARAALEAGASLVNDISAFRFDPAMLPLLSETGAPAVAMHTLAEPAVMQDDPRYDDVVSDVVGHLQARLRACEDAGVDPRQILLDPGIGFGKTVDHNLRLLRGLPALAALGRPVLIGTSRKGFLGALTGRPVDQRLDATRASVAAAVALGAHVVRVHDVAAHRDTVIVAGAIARGRSQPER